MAFWGTGKPKIEIISPAGAVLQTYNLPAPQTRSFGWPLEGDPQVNPFTGMYLERRFGFRPFMRLTYAGADISATVEDLLEIVNSKNAIIKLTPHVDMPDINWIGIVSEFSTSHSDGKVVSDIVEIEFKGVNRRESIPNIDTFLTVSPTSTKLMKDLS